MLLYFSVTTKHPDSHKSWADVWVCPDGNRNSGWHGDTHRAVFDGWTVSIDDGRTQFDTAPSGMYTVTIAGMSHQVSVSEADVLAGNVIEVT